MNLQFQEGAAAPPIEPVLSMLLDELDYGVVLLLRDSAAVVYVNQAARTQLREGQGLALVDGALGARRASDAPLLADALAAARRGLRRLITLGAQDSRTELALIPIGASLGAGQPLVAAVFGRRLCERMSMEWFARSRADASGVGRVAAAVQRPGPARHCCGQQGAHGYGAHAADLHPRQNRCWQHSRAAAAPGHAAADGQFAAFCTLTARAAC